MNSSDFKNLLKSINEARAIKAGKRKPWRSYNLMAKLRAGHRDAKNLKGRFIG